MWTKKQANVFMHNTHVYNYATQIVHTKKTQANELMNDSHVYNYTT